MPRRADPRRQEREQIGKLDVSALKQLREHASQRVADVDVALRGKGVVSASDSSVGLLARGRPTKITPALIQTVVTTILAGNYREVAAQRAGISSDTFRRWMVMGSRGRRGLFAEFYSAVITAEHEAEIKAVGLVLKAAENTDARHAEWWLERKFHERWGRRDRVEVAGRNGGPIELSTYVYLPANGREIDPEQVRAMPEDVIEVAEVRAIPEHVERAAAQIVVLPPSGRE